MMRRVPAMLSVVIGVLGTSPVIAAPEPLTTGVQSENGTTLLINDKATELAQFLQSRQDMAKQLEQVLAVSLPQSMREVSDFGIYETEYPGLIDAIVAALKPVMLKAYDDKMPLLWANSSQIYRENFSPAELDQLLAFYKSPVGIRFINAAKGNVDIQQYMDAAVESQGELTDVVAATKDKADAAAIKKASRQMSAADKLAIFRFENSPLGPKLAAVGPLISKAVLDWDFYFTDAQKRSFVAIRQAAISQFIAKADAEKQSVIATPAAVAQSTP